MFLISSLNVTFLYEFNNIGNKYKVWGILPADCPDICDVSMLRPVQLFDSNCMPQEHMLMNILALNIHFFAFHAMLDVISHS